MIVIVLAIVIVGLFLAIFRPHIFVVFFGILGSDTGARGFTGFFDSIFPYYSLAMRVMLIVAMTVSLVRFFFRNREKTVFARWINLSLFYIVSMIATLLLYITDLSPLSFLSRVSIAICSFGPAVFIIWIAYSDCFDHKKSLLCYSLIQCGIAFIIIYGSFGGITQLSVLNAGLYNDGYFYLDENNSMVALPSNFYKAFIGKNAYFIRCGQFHNSNGLGFASGMLLFLCISSFFEKKKQVIKRILFLLVSLLSFLLWCNTGTRGPIIGLVVAIIFYFFFSKKDAGNNLLAICFMTPILLLIFLLSADSSLVSYFIGEGSSDSFESRRVLNQNAFSHFSDFFFSGCGGDMTMLFENDIDPHELPMRIFCLYGILPAILVTLLTIIKPFKYFFKKRMALSFYASGCFWITFFIGLTNNFAENVLFWIVLAEFVVSISSKNYDGTVFKNRKAFN